MGLLRTAFGITLTTAIACREVVFVSFLLATQVSLGGIQVQVIHIGLAAVVTLSVEVGITVDTGAVLCVAGLLTTMVNPLLIRGGTDIQDIGAVTLLPVKIREFLPHHVTAVLITFGIDSRVVNIDG